MRPSLQTKPHKGRNVALESSQDRRFRQEKAEKMDSVEKLCLATGHQRQRPASYCFLVLYVSANRLLRAWHGTFLEHEELI